MTLVLVIGIAMLVVAALLVGEAVTAPVRQRREPIDRVARYVGAGGRARGGRSAPFGKRVVAPLLRAAAGRAERVFPERAIANLRQRLVAAGLDHRLTPVLLLAKLAAAVAGGTLGTFAGRSSGGVSALLAGIGFGAAFFLIPDRLLAGWTRSRRDRIEAELPDALDLLAISVEAGLSLDAALAELVENLEGPLMDELALTLGEMRIGESRPEALRRLSDRVGVPGVSALTAAILQSDQLGISLGRILRTQASDARKRRQTAAEERANKLSVKMLFPTAIFIFPALFVVILGPALISVFTSL